jgi:hypothetical protein
VDQASSVGIATHYGLDGPGFKTPVGGEIFRTHPDWLRGPNSFLQNTYRVSFPGIKRPGCGVENPLQSVAEVKEVQRYTSTPSLGLHGLLWGELYCFYTSIHNCNVCNEVAALRWLLQLATYFVALPSVTLCRQHYVAHVDWVKRLSALTRNRPLDAQVSLELRCFRL